MTPQISQAADKHIESELDRLTYSAYLLTLDPGVAVSVVMTAIDGSLEEVTTGPDLLERTGRTRVRAVTPRVRNGRGW